MHICFKYTIICASQPPGTYPKTTVLTKFHSSRKLQRNWARWNYEMLTRNKSGSDCPQMWLIHIRFQYTFVCSASQNVLKCDLKKSQICVIWGQSDIYGGLTHLYSLVNDFFFFWQLVDMLNFYAPENIHENSKFLSNFMKKLYLMSRILY